jgi:hypothetical protein
MLTSYRFYRRKTRSSNDVPAKFQFLQFYLQQSWAFFRLPAKKIVIAVASELIL